MTKAKAIAAFKKHVLPVLKKLENGKPDYPRRSEEWGIYTDSLCKMGTITLKQYESWDLPNFCKKK